VQVPKQTKKKEEYQFERDDGQSLSADYGSENEEMEEDASENQEALDDGSDKDSS
jgi:hypothetical protein